MTAAGEGRALPPPVLVVGAIVVEDDHLLLVLRARPPAAGTWALPGGRVEGGETAVEAVVRELAEETGLEGICGDFMGWEEMIGEDHHAVILDFRVHLLEKAEPRAADDAAAARWVPVWDVAELHLAPGLAEFLHTHGVIDTFA